MLLDTATEDFFRLRLDHMVDLRHSLAVLSSRMPWQQIEASLAHRFSAKVRLCEVTSVMLEWVQVLRELTRTILVRPSGGLVVG